MQFFLHNFNGKFVKGVLSKRRKVNIVNHVYFQRKIFNLGEKVKKIFLLVEKFHFQILEFLIDLVWFFGRDAVLLHLIVQIFILIPTFFNLCFKAVYFFLLIGYLERMLWYHFTKLLIFFLKFQIFLFKIIWKILFFILPFARRTKKLSLKELFCR